MFAYSSLGRVRPSTLRTRQASAAGEPAQSSNPLALHLATNPSQGDITNGQILLRGGGVKRSF